VENNNNEQNTNQNQTKQQQITESVSDAISVNDTYRSIINPFSRHKSMYNDTNIFLSTMIGNPYCLDLDSTVPINEKTLSAINQNSKVKQIFEQTCKTDNPSYEDVLNFSSKIMEDNSLTSQEKNNVLKYISADVNEKQDKKQNVGSAIGWITTILGTGSTIVYLLANPQIIGLFAISPVLQWVLLGITIASALYLTATRIVNLMKSAKAQSNEKIENINEQLTKSNVNLQKQMQNEITNTSINNYHKIKQLQNVPIVQNRIQIQSKKQFNEQQPNNNLNKQMPTINNNSQKANKQENNVMQKQEVKKGILKDKNHVKNTDVHVKWKEPIEKEYTKNNNNFINLENNNSKKNSKNDLEK